jgi:chromosome segregation ATPase
MQALLQNQGVHAMLDLEFSEEPYLSGVTFGCIPPGKRYRRIEDLSGGEKTLAALTLIFSLQTSVLAASFSDFFVYMFSAALSCKIF